MKNTSTSFCLMLAIIMSFTIVCQAQTFLTAGDIAIVGFNSDSPRHNEFAFACFVAIDEGTEIIFTDCGWIFSNFGFSNFTNDGALMYTVPSGGLNAGDIVIYSGTSGPWSTYTGSVITHSFNLSTEGDQIIVFQGSDSSPTILYAVQFNGDEWDFIGWNQNTSALPPDLDGYEVAVGDINNGHYKLNFDVELLVHKGLISSSSFWQKTGGPFNFATIFSAPLPVELSSFSAVVKENSVILNWKTETEVNNYGFEVQRSAQPDKWDVLGFVDGNGNSNSPKEYNFIDNEVNSAGTYSYRLKQIDNDGTYEFSITIEVDFASPKSFELNQNYPNPFNPTTTISFTLPKSGNVALKVFNPLGEEVVTLTDEFIEAGIYTFNFNGEGLTSGMYIYQLSTSEKTQARKMLLMK
ncbi:T9SS type A sorting domain-containing protein [Bacteroidota bacterium]